MFMFHQIGSVLPIWTVSVACGKYENWSLLENTPILLEKRSTFDPFNR